MTIRHLILALALAASATGAMPAHAAEAPGAVQAEVARIAEESGGVVGVAAWRLDGNGSRLLFHANEAFPMASTFKIAVAGRILEKVDKGELTLDQMIAIGPEHMVASDVIADRFIHPGVALSVDNLLEVMLTLSDNSATDVLTEAAGGPAAVTAWVRAQGVTGLRIDRDTNGLLRAFFDTPTKATLAESFAALGKSETEIARIGLLPKPSFDDDPRDTATPTAMADLIGRIFSGKALSAASTKVLIDMMGRCRTGRERLSGRLPTGTVVAHKTGTIGGTVNDVGVIMLPDGGQLVIAAFVKKSAAPMEVRERAIADIARAAYDHFLFSANTR